MGRGIGLVTIGLGVVFWIVGAVAIAIWAEATHRTGTGGVINSTRFNFGLAIFCGALGFVVAARLVWKGARDEVRGLLNRLNGRGSISATTAAAGSWVPPPIVLWVTASVSRLPRWLVIRRLPGQARIECQAGEVMAL